MDIINTMLRLVIIFNVSQFVEDVAIKTLCDLLSKTPTALQFLLMTSLLSRRKIQWAVTISGKYF